ncbi:MAG: hypothetical protein LBN27_10940 [Prevotellaceae bacterium]|jgi:hypothetical protein|nr:hypothetical protein [Prevotellaceae bacterium]
MDIGNIIFIGVIAVAIISNAAKAAKKKNSQAKPLVGRPLQEAVLVQQQSKQAKNVPLTNRRERKPVAVPQQSIFEEGVRQLEEETPIEIVGADLQSVQVNDFSDREEIRKGIVFSEIFNRKY